MANGHLDENVADFEGAERMIRSAVEHFGDLHAVVNNAGIGQWHNAEEVAEEDWDRIMDINLKGVFLCAQAEARVMLDAGYGKIINMASMSGRNRWSPASGGRSPDLPWAPH